MRRALANALQPDLSKQDATATHSSLLQLARTREGALRLVTTNFDRTFEEVVTRANVQFGSFVAPMLPIPKNSQWDGLVYLHGLLPSENEDERALDRLVVTSGDFGLAYLTERWAARFVSELFQNFVVCFIGYSINDPVLRYMMDALAADRLRGEATPKAYALGACDQDQEEETTDNWKSKGVTPVLYNAVHHHALLHDTLKVWASDYRDGVRGKERVVVEYAISNPSESTRQDDFVGRMLWALSDKSGLPAKVFADFNPVPPLTWLETLSEDRFGHGDLSRFGVPSHTAVDDKLRFSMVSRPAPYKMAPWMTLVGDVSAGSDWDGVMVNLARWLVRHLNDPALVIWFAQHRGQLHDRWISLIEDQLDRIQGLQHQGNTREVDEVRAHAPNAIPRPLMQTLWRLLLTGRVKSHRHKFGLHGWMRRLKRHELTTSLRLELRKLLAPKVVLREPFRWKDAEEATAETEKISQLVDWELVLAADHVRSSLGDLADYRGGVILPELLDDLQQLLLDALGLLGELGEAEDRSDRSHWALPSISPHWQNRGFRDWVALIELLRDSWVATRESDPVRANQVVQRWFGLPYPTFKRLALFAASQDDCIAPDEWLEWLVDDEAWWLWSVETQRETMRLLVSQGNLLSPQAKAQLELTILAGPPRSMYPNDIEPDKWDRIVSDSVWVLLTKFAHKEEELSPFARSTLGQIRPSGANWLSTRNNERNEFSHWMSGTGDPDYEENRDLDIAPRKRQDLVRWLKQPPPKERPFYEDTWPDTCRTRFFHSFSALCDLAQEDLWPSARWKQALQVWSEEGKVTRSWRFAGPLVQRMPKHVVQESAPAIAWWLEAVSKSTDRHQTMLLELCGRILDQSYQDETGPNQPVFQAINHPIGLVTKAMLNLWFGRQPNDDDTLPTDIEPIFARLCDTRIGHFRFGRVVLSSRLVALFRVDRDWTEKYLFPVFDWSVNPDEAMGAWQGFLWSPRLYRPLLVAFKDQFMETARHYSALGEYSHQFAQFLTYAALDPMDGYVAGDFQTAMEALPKEGLEEAAQALGQALEGSGEQREDYWKSRIQPLWQDVWPKSSDLASNSISESLALLSIASRDECPGALAAVLDWLRPVEHPDYVVHRLCESGLCARFPPDTLQLLDAVIADGSFAPKELRQCLEAIGQASPELRHDRRYRRLDEYAQRSGT